MTSKAYDLVVKTGEYVDQHGQTKTRYENIGSVMVKDDGGKFLIMKRTFNPAGVPNPENRDSLIVSLFEPDRQGAVAQQAAQQQPVQQPQQQVRQHNMPPQGVSGPTTDDIPF